MSPPPARPIGRGLVAFASVVAALLGACGDGPICQQEALVVIRSPQGPLAADGDPQADGLQADVVVTTTLPRDAALELEVFDAEDNLVATRDTRAGAEGDAVFEDVTIPPGGARLVVRGDAGVCGGDVDEVLVTLIGGGDCALAFTTAPVEVAFYAPLPVFNVSTDRNPQTPEHQGDVRVTARPGELVRLLVSGPGMPETEVAGGTAGDDGTVALAVSLPDGQVALRAECGAAGAPRSSGVTSVFVDTTAPTCAIDAPVPGTSITPAMDGDDDPSNGIQLVLIGHAEGGDLAGEAATFTVTAPDGGTTALVGTDVSSGGESTADATFDPDDPPADFGVRFATQDHAQNPCTTDETFRVVLDGCAIALVAPTTTVTTDADAAAAGAQVDIVADVDDACIGRAITSDCGTDDPVATVGPGGAVSLRATVCSGTPCEAEELCTLRVTSADGIETTAGVDLRYDDVAPNVTFAVAAPSGVACGTSVTPSQDVDGAAPGTQIRVRVTSPAAATRAVRLTNASGTVTTPVTAPGGELVVTIADGANTFVGLATDAAGNTGSSAECAVILAALAVNFTGAAADGLVGAADGTVAAGRLAFTLTGTVSAPGASVTVSVDGGPATSATTTGTTWSIALDLAGRSAPYLIGATAVAGPGLGNAVLTLVVDLAPPAAAAGLTAVADTRQSIRLAFTVPGTNPDDAAAYRVRVATAAFTDATFDTAGTAVAVAPPAPIGSPDVVRVRPLRPGTAYWVGVAVVDRAGNRSPAQIVGPLTPRFDQAAVTAAPNTSGTAGFGLAMVRGRFDDDDFDDVAVGAPFVTAAGLDGAGEVYVYRGSATGLAATPSLTLRGAAAGDAFGSSLAAVARAGGTRHGLAVGAPNVAGNGAIFVFAGGAAFPSGTVAAGAATTRITVATPANFFTGSALGWQLAAADHDGDGTDDLVASAIFGRMVEHGAIVVFYGGTLPAGDVRISDTSAAGSGAAVIRMYDDPDTTTSLFGYYLHAVGPTGGAADLTDDLVAGYAEDMLPGATVVVLRGEGRPAAPGVTRTPFTPGRDVRLRHVTSDVALEWGAAVGSIADQNGDGARDLVLADFRDQGDNGVAFIVDGDATGTAGTALLTTPGVTLTTIRNPVNGEQFGMAVVNNARAARPDVDGDGIEDLILAARQPGSTQAVLDVWFGPIAPGVQSPPAPDHVITGPASFRGVRPNIGGSAITALWAGDVNADGLDDVCWADWTSNSLDGGFQLVWDDGS